MKKTFIVSIFTVSLLLIGSFATTSLMAQEKQREGLFVRTLWTVGSHASGTQKQKGGGKIKYSGIGGHQAAISIGGFVVPNLALHGGWDHTLTYGLTQKGESIGRKKSG